MTVFEIISKYKEAFESGLLVTLKLSLIIWIGGLIIGSFLGVLGSRFKKFFGYPIRLISFILSGIPILVLLFWLHYPLQALLNVVIDPFYTSCFALSLVNAFGVSSIIRNAINELPSQYKEAALVCGLSKSKTLFKIELPLIFRSVIPSLLFLQVNMLQLTLFASLISVEEIFRISQQINSQIYQPVEIYTALGIFFLLVCLPLNGFAYFLKYKYSRDFSEK